MPVDVLGEILMGLVGAHRQVVLQGNLGRLAKLGFGPGRVRGDCWGNKTGSPRHPERPRILTAPDSISPPFTDFTAGWPAQAVAPTPRQNKTANANAKRPVFMLVFMFMKNPFRVSRQRTAIQTKRPTVPDGVILVRVIGKARGWARRWFSMQNQ